MSSAKVTLKEVDLSTRVPRFTGIAAGIVLPAHRGAVDTPVLVTSEEEFIDVFGEPDPKLGLAHYSALAFLSQSNKLYVVRVHNGAAYGVHCAPYVGKKEPEALVPSEPIKSIRSFDFKSNDSVAGAFVAAYPAAENNKLSYSIEPSKNYKNGYIIKVYLDTTGGTELVETHEVTRESFKSLNNSQMRVDHVLANRSQYLRFINNVLCVDEKGNPAPFSVGQKYDIHLAKEPYTLKAGETLTKGVDPKKGTIVFDDGLFWEYVGADNQTEGYTITPADFTADKTKALWKLVTYKPTVYKLAGGSDGEAITVGQLIKGAEKMSQAETYDIKIFMDGGYTDHAYHTALLEIAKKRVNSICYFSADPEAEKLPTSRAQAVVNYRKESQANSSYGGLFSPHVKVYDKYNDIYVEAGPDGFVAAAMAYTARNNNMWTPAAGWDNGMLAVSGLTAVYTEGERDILYDNGVNPIRQAANKGIAIWGNKTLQAKPSALDRLNVRMLLIVIEPSVMDFLDYFEFKVNDQITRLLISDGLTALMKDIKSKGGVYDFKVICDETNNTPAIIDNNELYADIYVKPVKAAEYITFRTVITTTGANFNAVTLG